MIQLMFNQTFCSCSEEIDLETISRPLASHVTVKDDDLAS